jgi:hypothetical protein
MWGFGGLADNFMFNTLAALGENGKWGQCANLDRIYLCPIFAGKMGSVCKS